MPRSSFAWASAHPSDMAAARDMLLARDVLLAQDVPLPPARPEGGEAGRQDGPGGQGRAASPDAPPRQEEPGVQKPGSRKKPAASDAGGSEPAGETGERSARLGHRAAALRGAREGSTCRRPAGAEGLRASRRSSTSLRASRR